MPYLTLAATKTAGNDEVLSALKFLSRGAALHRNGVSQDMIVEYLQAGSFPAQHPARLATLKTQVATVLTNLTTLGYVTTSTNAVSLGEAGVTGYKLTRTGVLPSRRAKPYALRP